MENGKPRTFRVEIAWKTIIKVLLGVAAYPVLERLWLARRLDPEVVKDHQEQLRAA